MPQGAVRLYRREHAFRIMGTRMLSTTVDAETERHRQTWLGFCRFMRIMVVVIVLILAGMALFLL